MTDRTKDGGVGQSDGMEYKTVAAEFKASASDEGVYEGYFSVFGNVDDGGDIIMPGAFSKTIAERRKRIKVLYQHDFEKLIGPAPDVLEEDTKGLYAKGRLTISRGGNKGAFWADECWALMKDDALNEGSMGYRSLPERTDWNDSYTVRTMHEVKLFEISPVPLGMNPLTELRAVKAMQLTGERGIEAQIAALAVAREALYGELKEGRVLSAQNLEKVKSVKSAMSDLMQLLQELEDAATPREDGDKSADLHLAPLQLKARLQRLGIELVGA